MARQSGELRDLRELRDQKDTRDPALTREVLLYCLPALLVGIGLAGGAYSADAVGLCAV